MTKTVIAGGARTPIGRLSGGFASLSGAELGGHAIAAALERSNVAASDVDYVIMGQVLMAGQGQVPARQAAVKAGIPLNVPAVNINKVCLSGLNTIYLADQMIQSGDADIVVAGGMESMTNAPHLLPKSREGYKYGDVNLVDSMAYDGLFCAFDQVAMGAGTEAYNTSKYQLTRAEQDAFSARSHQLAARAWKDGLFDDEVVTVTIPQRRGDALEFRTDQGADFNGHAPTCAHQSLRL